MVVSVKLEKVARDAILSCTDKMVYHCTTQKVVWSSWFPKNIKDLAWKSLIVEDVKPLGPSDLPPRPSATYRQNSLTNDKSKVLSDMIKSYMKITHKTLLDITPKYIIMSLVQAVSFLDIF